MKINKEHELTIMWGKIGGGSSKIVQNTVFTLGF